MISSTSENQNFLWDQDLELGPIPFTLKFYIN